MSVYVFCTVATIPEQLGHCCCGHPHSHEARSRSSSGGKWMTCCVKSLLNAHESLFPLNSTLGHIVCGIVFIGNIISLMIAIFPRTLIFL